MLKVPKRTGIANGMLASSAPMPPLAAAPAAPVTEQAAAEAFQGAPPAAVGSE